MEYGEKFNIKKFHLTWQWKWEKGIEVHSITFEIYMPYNYTHLEKWRRRNMSSEI